MASLIIISSAPAADSCHAHLHHLDSYAAEAPRRSSFRQFLPRSELASNSGENRRRLPQLAAAAGIAAAEDSRREFLVRMGAFAVSFMGPSLVPMREEARAADLGLGLGLGLGLESSQEEAPDVSITDRVFLDISKCPSSFSTSREIGAEAGTRSRIANVMNASQALSDFHCDDGEALGRVVIGLYGKQVPQTVANFKAMCTGKAGSSYKGCLIHRIIAGQYIMTGKQGPSKEKGEVLPPSNLDTNLETVSSHAFKLSHARPGTVSLCLSENDDEDQFKLSTDYHNVEFLITTGPGPAPQLDNKNIVFGRVLEGLDVIRAAAAVPVYKPNQSIRQLNELASFLGDGRASNARNFWYRPLMALYISDCGEVV